MLILGSSLVPIARNFDSGAWRVALADALSRLIGEGVYIGISLQLVPLEKNIFSTPFCRWIAIRALAQKVRLRSESVAYSTEATLFPAILYVLFLV